MKIRFLTALWAEILSLLQFSAALAANALFLTALRSSALGAEILSVDKRRSALHAHIGRIRVLLLVVLLRAAKGRAAFVLFPAGFMVRDAAFGAHFYGVALFDFRLAKRTDFANVVFHSEPPLFD